MKDKNTIGIRIVHSKRIISIIKSAMVLIIKTKTKLIMPNNKTMRLHLSIMKDIGKLITLIFIMILKEYNINQDCV